MFDQSNITLTILGSGTCVPSQSQSSPGYLLETTKHLILLDSGSGTIHRLLETKHSYTDIDYIFYTHTHADHVSDLVPLLMAMLYTPGFSRRKPLSIFGPSGFRNFFLGLAKLYGKWLAEPNYKLDIYELDAESRSFGKMQVVSKPMEHGRPSIGYRFETDKKAFAYSGDTDYCENIVKLAHEADIALLECSFPDEMKMDGHLTPTLAGQIAQEAHCKRLLLTHRYPPCEVIDIKKLCAMKFKGEIEVVRDLQIISL